MKLHIDDKVLVTAGKYRGKSGKVLRLNEKQNKVVVEKVNIRTRHVKKSAGKPGERIKYEAFFSASNVMVVCPHCSKPTRVGYAILKDGRKQRLCKKCKQSLDKAVETKKTKKK